MSGSKWLLLVGLALVLIAAPVWAQSADTMAATADTVQIAPEEIVLEEIYIEAVIEKPNVAILPTREKPDFGEIEFVNRSFEYELKAPPDRFMLLSRELYSAKKLREVKKILDKEGK